MTAPVKNLPSPPSDDLLLQRFGIQLTRQDLSPSSVRAYISDLHQLQQWLVWLHEGSRHVPLAEVTHTDLRAFRKHLIHKERQRPATVNRRVQALRRFYAWLNGEGVMAQDPARELRFIRDSARRRPRGLKLGEVLALIRAAEGSSQGLAIRNTTIVQLMLQTGLRVGELAALTRADITLGARSGVVEVREGKGLKHRIVPLNTTARRALSAYLERSGEGPRLFMSRRGRPLSVRSIQHVIKVLAEEAKITRLSVSAHTLRHSFATSYLRSHPGKLVELSSLLGHESLDTTAVYTHPSQEDLSEDLETSDINLG
jgi:site-specific recombinase XerD